MAVTILTSASESTPASARVEGDRLLVRSDELLGSTGWELKPEGMCRGEICVPLPADRASSVVAERDGATWVDVAGFARYLKQTFAHDAATETWYFGPGPDEQRGQFQLLDAPDFELPDQNGKKHRLSDYRGKKVLLALWASW
jgi:hypothetical protein